MAYVKLKGSRIPGDGTQGYVVERDGDGNVTKSVELGVPVEINATQKKKLEALGAVFEDSSIDEVKQHEEESVLTAVGDDIAGSAPQFAPTVEPDAQQGKSGKN